MAQTTQTNRRRYLAALRRNAQAPAEWQERIASTGGVTVLGRTETRMQFEADPETARELGNELGSAITVEETVERNPLQG
jgi:hypothetical protein